MPHLLFLAWGRKPASRAPGHQRAINAGKRRVLKAIRGLPARRSSGSSAEPMQEPPPPGASMPFWEAPDRFTVNSPGWHAAQAHDYPHDPGPVARPPMPGSRPVTHQRFHQAKDQPTIVRTCAVSHARRRLARPARRQIDPCGGGTS